MTEKKTENGPGTAQAAQDSAPKPGAEREKRPVRRVGSMTLGLCLIALGACFLCYYLLPSFDWVLVVKIGAPLVLIALGIEVLVCAARPDKWRYDFWAVFSCLIIIAAAFCLSLLPLLWQEFSPERRANLDALGEQYRLALYDELKDDELALEGLSVYIETNRSAAQPEQLDDLDAGGVHLYLNVELYGPYETKEAFAQDCARVLAAVQAQDALPEQVELRWGDAEDGRSYSLSLSDRVQLEWSEPQLAEHVQSYSFDAEEEYDEGELSLENSADSAETAEVVGVTVLLDEEPAA